MSTLKTFQPRFPCPHCGKQRQSTSASCFHCGYPNHDRRPEPISDPKPAPSAKSSRRPFQFHLSALFIATTLASIVFALYTRLGQNRFIEGLQVAGEILAIFYPVLEFFYHWTRNIYLDEEPRESSSSGQNQQCH